MSQTLLFIIGVVVFGIAVVGILLYAYALANRAFQDGIDSQSTEPRAPLTRIDGPPVPVVTSVVT